MGIEARGDQDHLRLKSIQRRQPALLEHLSCCGTVAAGSQRHVDHIRRRVLGAAARIEGMLEKARHQQVVPPLRCAKHILRAVAVVDVEVDYRDSLEPLLLQRVGSGHADVVEYAKAHRAALRCVVAARAHRAERVQYPPSHHLVHRQQPRAGRAPRRSEAVRVHHRIGVELHITLHGRILENQVDVGRAVHALEVVRVRKWRLQAQQLLQQPARAHVLVDRCQAGRAFGVASAHLMAQAVRVGDVGCSHGEYSEPGRTAQ